MAILLLIIFFIPLCLHYMTYIVNNWPTPTTIVNLDVYKEAPREKVKVVSPQVFSTSSKLIDDAVAALVSTKMKKSDAIVLIHGLVSKKRYTDLNTLIMDAFKR